MLLEILSEIDLTDFCNWLMPQIQEYLEKNINEKKLEKINIYLNGEKSILFDYSGKRILSAKNILLGGVHNLRVARILDKYTIEINPNILIPNTSAKFIDIVKLINYGNMSVQGYPIMTKTMDYFADNLNKYYLKFLEEANTK